MQSAKPCCVQKRGEGILHYHLFFQGFFNSLRTELTDYPEISVINICPGPVQSNIIQNVFTENLSKVRTQLCCDKSNCCCTLSDPLVDFFYFSPPSKHQPHLLPKKCFDWCRSTYSLAICCGIKSIPSENEIWELLWLLSSNSYSPSLVRFTVQLQF